MDLKFCRSAVISFLALGALVACENSRQVEDPKAKNSPTDTGDEVGDEGTDSEGTATEAGSGEGKYSGCGFSAFSATTSINKQSIRSADLRFTGTAGSVFTTEYNVTVASTIGYSGNFEEIVVSNAMEIINASPAKARTEAQVEINKLTGNQKIGVLSPKKWESTAKSAGWDNIFCSLIPAEKISEVNQAHFTEVEFKPAVPYLVSPLLSAARFKKEIGNGKTFDDIEAHVISTSNPKLSNDQKLDGSVNISPVESKTSYTSSEGGSRSIDADYAYKIEFNFGEGSTQIGLNKGVTYYVKKGKFVAIIVDTGDDKAPFVQFHPDE